MTFAPMGRWAKAEATGHQFMQTKGKHKNKVVAQVVKDYRECGDIVSEAHFSAVLDGRPLLPADNIAASLGPRPKARIPKHEPPKRAFGNAMYENQGLSTQAPGSSGSQSALNRPKAKGKKPKRGAHGRHKQRKLGAQNPLVKDVEDADEEDEGDEEDEDDTIAPPLNKKQKKAPATAAEDSHMKET